MNVGTLCEREVDRIDEGHTVRDAAERMLHRAVGSLVVVADDRPAGILTDRDITTRVVARGLDPISTPVHEVMTRDPESVHEGASVDEALGVFRNRACRRLPVVSEDGRLVGILTLDDVLIHLSHQFRYIGDAVLKETPRESLTGRA